MPPKFFDTPGMPCPRCKFRIKVSLTELLSARTISCPGCLLELELDRSGSQESLELAQKLAVASANLERFRKMSF